MYHLLSHFPCFQCCEVNLVFYCCQALLHIRHAASRLECRDSSVEIRDARQNDDCRVKNTVWMARLPLPANSIATLTDMTCRTRGNITCRVIISCHARRKIDVLCEYLVFCLLRGLCVGANLLLYKSHRGISSKSPNPSQVLIVNHREPTNAIPKTHPFVKTPFVPFIIQS
jgi:hypothetical protein